MMIHIDTCISLRQKLLLKIVLKIQVMLQTWQNIEETGLYNLRFVYRDEELKLGELLACMEENEQSNLAGE